jgi:hypothetical protein
LGSFRNLPSQRYRVANRFFPIALMLLPRIAFAAIAGFDPLAGSAERAGAALVTRTGSN